MSSASVYSEVDRLRSSFDCDKAIGTTVLDDSFTLIGLLPFCSSIIITCSDETKTKAACNSIKTRFWSMNTGAILCRPCGTCGKQCYSMSAHFPKPKRYAYIQ